MLPEYPCEAETTAACHCKHSPMLLGTPDKPHSLLLSMASGTIGILLIFTAEEYPGDLQTRSLQDSHSLFSNLHTTVACDMNFLLLLQLSKLCSFHLFHESHRRQDDYSLLGQILCI